MEISLPKPYTQRVRNALSASSKAVNLRNLGGGPFFRAGVKLDETFVHFHHSPTHNDMHMHMIWYRINDDKLKEILHKAFKDRLAEVFDHAQHASSIPLASSMARAGAGGANQAPVDHQAAEFMAGMDDWEKECELFMF